MKLESAIITDRLSTENGLFESLRYSFQLSGIIEIEIERI
jgi:hypothetical protein